MRRIYVTLLVKIRKSRGLNSQVFSFPYSMFICGSLQSRSTVTILNEGAIVIRYSEGRQQGPKYRELIKYWFFSLKCCDFSELCIHPHSSNFFLCVKHNFNFLRGAKSLRVKRPNMLFKNVYRFGPCYRRNLLRM